MILREIFTEFGDIFNLTYEKNRNGSYRVNTVIRELVYDQLYETCDYNDNQIGYFLKYPDMSYQNFPNIRNSFSELMNPKDESNRFPVLEFANSINMDNMYSYYDALVKSLDEEHYGRLQAFVNDIFEKTPVLHARLRIVCTNIHEYITWIIIFAMFNSQMADAKLEEYVDTRQAIMISEPVIRHRFADVINKRTARLSFLTGTLVVLVMLQFLMALAPVFFASYFNRMTSFQRTTYTICLLLYVIVVLLFWFFQSRYSINLAELKTISKYMDDYPEYKEPDSFKGFILTSYKGESAHEMRRSSFRKVQYIITIILLTISIIPSIMLKSFPVLVSLWIFWSLCDVWVDRIINDYIIRTYYDSLTIPEGEKPRPYRGLAKIYKWEYDKTKFDINNPYYKDTIPLHSRDCYRNIFHISYDRLRWSIINEHLIVFYINFFVVLLVLLNQQFGDKTTYFKLPGFIDVNFFAMIYIITAGLFCVIIALGNSERSDRLAKLAHSIIHINNHPDDTEKVFIELKCDNLISDVDQARGIFVYSISCFEKGMLAEDINPESDRMLFVHRVPALRVVIRTTMLMIYAIAVLMLVWNMHKYYLFPVISMAALLIYYIIVKLVLPRFHKNKIIKEIIKL